MATEGSPATPFRRALMNRSAFPCPGFARIAAAVTCSRRVVKLSTRKTSYGGPWCAALLSRWAVCLGCARQVQGRHPLQTSDAVGVGAVQLRPEALTLAAILNKQMGLSLGHTQQVLGYGFGLQASRAGL